jgi:hypothetical protein
MHGLMGSFTAHLAEEVPGDVKDARRAAKVTSFLFLRYRLQSFKVETEIPDQHEIIVVISQKTRSLTNIWNQNGRNYSICPKV